MRMAYLEFGSSTTITLASHMESLDNDFFSLIQKTGHAIKARGLSFCYVLLLS